MTAFPDTPTAWPDPLQRVPRLREAEQRGLVRAHLYPPPPTLRGAVAAIITRHHLAPIQNPAERMSHYAATPVMTLSWAVGGPAGRLQTTASGTHWQPFEAAVMVSGTQSQPLVSWSPKGGRGGFICFMPAVARRLFGLDPLALQDRLISAWEALGSEWHPFLHDLLAAPDDPTALAVIESFLAPRWQALNAAEASRERGSGSPLHSIRRLGRQWVEHLGWLAHDWRQVHSPRHVERRIRQFSGRSLREWQGLVKAEGVFFRFRDHLDEGAAPDLAGLAIDEGFSDQAHLNRVVKRITGFSPGEFGQRYLHDESFWLYRLWV
ncbi:MAG: helix-turn-helix domain-containing protein [Zoogloea sp.]|uniref:AraC family transcriptional regulator n=1 Tax=Zoogloea sp. TaxID=49181 RepID=UPI003F2FB366